MELYPDLEKMVDEFAKEMKKKLLQKQKEGYSGYSAPRLQGAITQKMKRNIQQKDWVDVANLAAMRWYYKETNRIYLEEE